MAALKLAGERVVGKIKPKRKNRVWMNAHVRVIIRKCNRLRKGIGANREEWKAACQEVTEAIIETKASSWNNLLDSALLDQDPSKVWSIVRLLNGTPNPNSPNEAFIHNKKTLADPKAKSNAFCQHYANVSTHAMSREDMHLNLRFKKRAGSPSVLSSS